MVKDLNMHTKTREELFEILDESKVDVLKLNDFMTMMAANQGQSMLNHIAWQNQ